MTKENKKTINLQEQLNKIQSVKKHKITLDIPNRGVKSIATIINLILAYSISYLLSLLIAHKIDNLITSQIDPMINGVSIDMELLLSFLHFLYPLFICIFVFSIMGFFTGFTPGDRIFRLNVYDYESKQQINFTQRLTRFFLFLIDLLFCLGIGTMVAIFNKEGRTFADKISKTIILQNKTTL